MTKKSYLEKRAELIREAYNKGRDDALRNIDVNGNRLSPDATAALMGAAEAEHAVGDQRLAYIMRLCLTAMGDPTVIAEMSQTEGIVADLDMSKLS